MVGLKPSRGRTSQAPLYGDILAGFFVEHVLTRSVRDCAGLLDVVAGPVSGDPYCAPTSMRPYANEVEHEPGQLRIGYSTVTPLGDELDSECKGAIEDTALLLDSLGHVVTEAAPAFDATELWTKYTTLLSSLAAWMLADWSRRLNREATEAEFEPFVWAFAERGRALSAQDYLFAMQDVQVQVRNLSNQTTAVAAVRALPRRRAGKNLAVVIWL